MYLLNPKSKVSRGINLSLICTLIMQFTVPSIYAMETLAHPELLKLKKENAEAVKTGSDYKKEISLTKELLSNKVIAKSLSFKSTGGPGQKESSNHSLGANGDLVDKFTGDFSYSIPLMDVEGYPVVINYNSNVNMNSESSWVGLGWDLNIGSVTRDMRGLPDEFNGEQTVVKTFHQADDYETGGKNGLYAAYGKKLSWSNCDFKPTIQATALFGNYDNTYLGHGRTFTFGLNAKLSIGNPLYVAPAYSFGYSKDTKRGIGVNNNFSMELGYGKENGNNESNIGLGATFGKSFHSRQGMTEKSYGLFISGEHAFDIKNFNMGYEGRVSATSSVPYGTISMLPSVGMNSKSWNKIPLETDLFVAVGVGSNLFKLGMISSTHESNRGITTNSQSNIVMPALGYFHSGKRNQYTNTESSDCTVTPMMDFNRSNDVEMSEEMTNLAFSVQTYDVFRANALGLGATFRARRADVGTYIDPTNVLDGKGTGNTGTLGLTTKNSKISLQIGYTRMNSENELISGNFEAPDGANLLEFISESKGPKFDASVYFKGVGEMTPEDMTDYTNAGGIAPQKVSMETYDNDKEIRLNTTGFTDLINVNQDMKPVKAYSYRPYTAEEYYAGNPSYHSYTSFGTTPEYIFRLSSNSDKNKPNAENHLSAVEVTNTDGTRYTFGIPAYDIKSGNVSFAATGLIATTPTTIANQGYITYTPGTDNSINNNRNVSKYFDKTEVPSYPHSFLLTKMLSSDYVDRMGDGPTLDDVGAYYKFNYTRVYGNNNPYKWRFPLYPASASYDKGLLGTELDDKGHYSYGEKEIWYAQSVESKNMVAEFILDDRKDAYSVQDENGTFDSSKPLKCLRYIKLYNRNERLTQGTSAVPLQIIEFIYNYELCNNIPGHTGILSSQKGKLTLKAIKSYGGRSSENGLYSYQFDYDQSANLNYNPNAVDMWGNNKTVDANKPYDVFPYADQNITNAKNNCKSWKLIKITNPTKGTVEVSYEPDSYATVQNKKAMNHIDVYRMTNLIDFIRIQTENNLDPLLMYTSFYKDFHNENDLQNAFPPANWSNSLFNDFKDYFIKDKSHCKGNYRCDFGRIDLNKFPNNVIIFKIDNNLSSDLVGLSKDDAGKIIKEKYFTDGNAVIKDLYLKLHVSVKGTVNELVPTFAKIMDDRTDVFNDKIPNGYSDDIKSIGVMPASDDVGYEYAYVIIEPAQMKENEKKGEDSHDPNDIRHATQINSLQKSALHFIRRNLPDIVYGSCANCEVTDNDLDRAMAFGKDLNEAMLDKNYALTFITDYTTVRLYNPNNNKLGGNARVKSIKVRDNWNTISSETDGTYVWNYVYEKPRVHDRPNTSHGNAAFEPFSGIDENPLYMWESYTNIAKKFPDESKFTTLPYAQLLYPSPTVGYSKVKTSGDFFENATGITEYFTSYDYPVISSKTDIDKSVQTDKPKNIITGKTTDKFGYTQGYSIQTNDFHGKIKESRIIQGTTNTDVDNEVIVSRSTYKYAPLGSTVPMTNRSGQTSPQTVATEYDMHADSRYIIDHFHYQTIGGDLTFMIIPFSPIPIPSPAFSISSRTKAFYSHTFIKHINRSAICKGIETEYLGSINTADNIAYDYNSGNVILSSLKDEYNDQLFSLSYPSHWYYRELREVNNVEGTTITTAVSNIGELQSANIEEVLSPGDKVVLTDAPGTPTLTVAKKNTLGGAITLFLINSVTGVNYTPTQASFYSIKILKTNRDNRLNESMQSITSKKNLFVNNQVVFPTTEIINAQAITYKDRNSYKCISQSELPPETSPGLIETVTGSTINPYLTGSRGDLVVDGQYALQTERINDQHAYKTRFDGTYSSFSPYYELNANGKWYPITDGTHSSYTNNNWRKSTEATFYDSFANTTESRNQLGIYSAVLYQFNNELNLLPVAQAVNAHQRDIAYDGFEDYGYYSTTNLQSHTSHFDFKSKENGTTIVLDNAKRHSGKYSFRLSPTVTTTITKKVKQEIGDCERDSKDYIEALECNCLKDFEPVPGKYIIGAWVRNDDPTAIAPGQIQVVTDGTLPVNTTYSATGVVLDGWQRMEGSFTIPSNATSISVSLKNTSGSVTTNFDDLRIHPFQAAMSTVAYDAQTLLPLATHDGNNFTTFYNYDENYNLVRVRVETIEGIKTISESEIGGYKQ